MLTQKNIVLHCHLKKKQWLYNNWCIFLFSKSWFSNANGLVSYFLLFAMHWNILVEINLQIALFFFLFTVLSAIHKNWNTPSITLSTLPGSCSSTDTNTGSPQDKCDLHWTRLTCDWCAHVCVQTSVCTVLCGACVCFY